eukprot:Tbor_TRINITY_DN3557_c0_g1::TRINITY_DN3557_c0_g1_i1::g.2926::m.2926
MDKQFEKRTITKCLSFRDQRVDDICSQVRKNIELRSKFGENYVQSRTLQNIFKSIDFEHRDRVSVTELIKALQIMNISIYCSDEADDCFDCFDLDRSGCMTGKQFSDAVFCNTVPYGSTEVRAIARRIKMTIYSWATSSSSLSSQPPSDSLVAKLANSLMTIDESKHSLTKQELFNCLQKFGFKSISVTDIDVLFKYFDLKKTGFIRITDFLRTIRGRIPSGRRDLVRQVFRILDTNNRGAISMDTIKARFDPMRHPKVIYHQRSSDNVVSDLLDAFWLLPSDASITLDEWEYCYTDISAGIDIDDYFELMMRSCWHIPVVCDNSKNSSYRQVLVYYKDGHQTIENVKDELSGSKCKILADLRSQGINNVVKVEMY